MSSDKPIAIHELAGQWRGECERPEEFRCPHLLCASDLAASLADLVRQVEAWRDEAERNAARSYKIGAYYPDEWSSQVKTYNRMLELLRGPRC